LVEHLFISISAVRKRKKKASPPTSKMDYNMEDSQNSAPGNAQAAKLNSGNKGPDSQSTTKR
jgi:hypothetical protein